MNRGEREPGPRREPGRGITRRWLLAASGALGLAVSLAGLRLRYSPVAPGSLTGIPPDAAGAYPVGEFVITLEAAGDPSTATLSVAHRGELGRVLWRSLPGESFVSAARGREEVSQRSGHFTVEDRILARHLDQTVERVERDGDALVLSGQLSGAGDSVGYTLRFTPVAEDRLRFEVEAEEPCNRVYLGYASHPEERFFGFGAQYTYFDLKGRRVPILIQEQGIGRGAQPITLGANLQAGAGGNWYTTYACVPHYVTSELCSLFLESSEYSVFDLRDARRVRIEIFSGRMSGQILSGSSPKELVESYTRYSGRMRPLPGWMHDGAVVGLQGGTQTVLERFEELERLGTPVAALWLQDWVGQRRTSFGQQLWWNWELDRDHYPGWDDLQSYLADRGVRLMTYVNPFLADSSEKENHRRNLFAEARENEYLVKDRGGGPYMIEITDFSAALVDLTNPEARGWLKGVLKEQFAETGVSGWMADFGEGLPYDAVLYSGADPGSYHNRYAEEWARLNREVVRELGGEEDLVFFTRSGYTQSPGSSTLFWLGDQLVSWDRHDGIKTAITGMLSSGLSGYSLNHSDTGGYTAIDNPLLTYRRSKELLLRWIELSAFTTVFRTHEGNLPEMNHQVYSDRETLLHFARFAKVYRAWRPYRERLVREATDTGLPVVRHPFVHNPDDPWVYELRWQFMVGPEMMIAPVVDAGRDEAEVYLPAGGWIHLWSGEEYGSPEGTLQTVEAPIGRPAVFYAKNSGAGAELREELRREGLL